ncbi:5'-nucleotidase, cytosolic III [Entophlyctis sp. JEL0112]|nr:5'-nucleotidase, cytosolic III [Entophlyctis sp. JEL0112]
MEVLESNQAIRMKNPDAVRAKIDAIAAGGPSKCHVISGYALVAGLLAQRPAQPLHPCRSDSQLARFGRGRFANAASKDSHALNVIQFRAQTDALYKKYYPMEISTTLTPKEKYDAMQEWWTLAHERIITLKLTQQDIAKIVATTESPVIFRAGSRAVIDAANAFEMPFLVFSAGIYDVIKEILVQNSLKLPNVHIVSNRMRFDPENGVCVGFEDPLIHTFNKNESRVHGAPYQESVESRPNLILMGDSLGDISMKEGVCYETALTIGFLNHDEEKFLMQYLDTFDVVVLGDSSMLFVSEMLKTAFSRRTDK